MATNRKDIRDVLEGHATERGRRNRGRGRLFGTVLIVDDIEMDRFERVFSVPEQNFGVREWHVRGNSPTRPCSAEPN